MQLVREQHRAARIKLPNSRVHACVHAIVENQIAEGLEPVVRAMARLKGEGLSRHDALHAVGSVVTDYIFDVMNTKDPRFGDTANERYCAGVDRLTAEEWYRKFAE